MCRIHWEFDNICTLTKITVSIFHSSCKCMSVIIFLFKLSILIIQHFNFCNTTIPHIKKCNGQALRNKYYISQQSYLKLPSDLCWRAFYIKGCKASFSLRIVGLKNTRNGARTLTIVLFLSAPPPNSRPPPSCFASNRFCFKHTFHDSYTDWLKLSNLTPSPCYLQHSNTICTIGRMGGQGRE